MKKVFAVCTVLITALVFITGCQPTPEKVTVVQKDSERMMEEAQKSPAEADIGPKLSIKEQYGIPETYTYHKQGADGKLNIHVDAQVVVPEESAMPIYRVVKSEFSQDTASAFFEVLCGDTEMWVYSGQKTKAQLQDGIVRINKRIKEIKDDPYSADELKTAKKSLAYCEEQLKTAPDTLVEERADGMLREMTETIPDIEQNTGETETSTPEPITYKGFSAYERYDNGTDGRGRTIDTINDSSPSMCYIDWRTPVGVANFGCSASTLITSDSDVDAEMLAKVGITPADAKMTVQELLDQTGSGMQVDSMYLQDDEQSGYYGEAAYPAENYAYRVYCVRSVDGIPCSYVQGGSRPDEKDLMSPAWGYETMEFLVNGGGIISMIWSDPIEVTETINEDAQLKPFSEIQEIFENMMSIEYEPQAEMYGNMDFEIDRVTLSLHRIIEQNSNERGLLVPAWNFYGKLILGTGIDQFEKLGETFMTINAIDGSIIDTSKGY